jgi:putative FmdB family regulatory protein
MPIFEYTCSDCDNRFELLVQASTRIACPSCQGTKLEKQLSVFAAGSGRDGFESRSLPAPAALVAIRAVPVPARLISAAALASPGFTRGYCADQSRCAGTGVCEAALGEKRFEILGVTLDLLPLIEPVDDPPSVLVVANVVVDVIAQVFAGE